MRESGGGGAVETSSPDSQLLQENRVASICRVSAFFNSFSLRNVSDIRLDIRFPCRE